MAARSMSDRCTARVFDVCSRFGLRAILCGRSIKCRSRHLCGHLFVVTAWFDSLRFAPIRASTVFRAEFSIRSNSRSAQFLELQR